MSTIASLTRKIMTSPSKALEGVFGMLIESIQSAINHQSFKVTSAGR
jgi:hypothetical protein